MKAVRVGTTEGPSKRFWSPSAIAPMHNIFFFYSYGDHRDLHSFPTRRSSDLVFMKNQQSDIRSIRLSLREIKQMDMIISHPLFSVLLLITGFSLFAQEDEKSDLFIALKKGDSLLFEEGFNKCNIAAVEKLITADFEFYHDQNGAQDRATFLKGFKESICSNPAYKPIRKLVKGSLVVYPLKNEGKLYGAIQMGIHDFYIKEPNKELRF